MPVRVFERKQGPADIGPGQAGLDMPVLDNVVPVVQVRELEVENGTVDKKGDDHQSQAEPKLEPRSWDFDQLSMRTLVRFPVRLNGSFAGRGPPHDTGPKTHLCRGFRVEKVVRSPCR